jgi:hypothetical protein
MQNYNTIIPIKQEEQKFWTPIFIFVIGFCILLNLDLLFTGQEPEPKLDPLFISPSRSGIKMMRLRNIGIDKENISTHN